jgi:hypothetical protein
MGDLRSDDHLPQWAIPDQTVIEVLFPDRFAVDPHAARGVSLGITIDQKGSLLRRRQRGREVDGRCGFAYTSLLIGHTYDFTHHLTEHAPRDGFCRTGADGSTKTDFAKGFLKKFSAENAIVNHYYS